MKKTSLHIVNQNRVINIIILIIIVSISCPEVIYGQDKFVKDLSFNPVKFAQTESSLIMGTITNTADNTYDIILLKTNQLGDSVWSKQYEFKETLTGIDIIKVNDEGFIILSYFDNTDTNGIALIKIDQMGDTLWTKELPGSYVPKAIEMSNDGGFVITGSIAMPDMENPMKILLMKTNATGELLWEKTFGGYANDYGYDIIIDEDGGFLFTGSYTHGESYGFLMKTNAGGDSLWMKSFLSSPESIIKTNGGGFMLLGGISGSSLIKINSAGDTLWTKSYNVSNSRGDGFNTIIQTSDGGYFIGGSIDSQFSTRPNFSTVASFKADPSGTLEWYRRYSKSLMGSSFVVDVMETDKGYKILSTTGHFFSTDQNGCFTQNPVIAGIDYFCSDDSTLLYTTQEFNSYIWSNGGDPDSIYLNLPGDYYVQVNDSLECPLWSDTISIVEKEIPLMDITPDKSSIICDGDSVDLTANILNFDSHKQYSYRWNYDSSTNNEIRVHLPGTYSLFVEDNFECNNTDSLEIILRYPYENEKICIVTVDPLTGKNLIIWEKTPDKGIHSYNIYRDEDEFIGNVPYDALSIFKDTIAAPESQQYLYSISVIDTCGNESPQSPWHKPLFLQYVSSIDGVNLRWSKYEIKDGVITFDNYEIWRGSDSTNLTPFAENITPQADAYTDADPAALERKYYYRIAGILDEPCEPSETMKAGTEAFRHSLSNMDNNKLKTGINPLLSPEGLFIYPNPFNRSATITFPNPGRESYKLLLSDLSGKIYRIADGITTSQYVLQKGSLKKGLFFIELRGPEIYRGKLVIE